MSKQLDAITAGLHEAGALKVWSLIITFFGDSVIARGGNVSASTVQSVLQKVDIGAGAVRTAFSRLAGDGWVVRERLGRQSYYQLSDDGIGLFAQASKQIYAPMIDADAGDCSWLFASHKNKSALTDLPINNMVVLPNQCLLIKNPDESAIERLRSSNFLCMQGKLSDIPEWVTQSLIDPDWVDQFDILQTTFKKLSGRPPTDPISALAARTLLIHQWRRLLLRYPALPPELKGVTLDAENACRAFVGQLYHRLNEPAEQWLSEHGRSLAGELPAPSSNPSARFTKRYAE